MIGERQSHLVDGLYPILNTFLTSIEAICVRLSKTSPLVAQSRQDTDLRTSNHSMSRVYVYFMHLANDMTSTFGSRLAAKQW